MNAALTPKLYGWKDIAKYIGCSKSTAKRYYKKLRLPVRYIERKPTADPSEVSEWLTKTGTRAPKT